MDSQRASVASIEGGGNHTPTRRIIFPWGSHRRRSMACCGAYHRAVLRRAGSRPHLRPFGEKLSSVAKKRDRNRRIQGMPAQPVYGAHGPEFHNKAVSARFASGTCVERIIRWVNRNDRAVAEALLTPTCFTLSATLCGPWVATMVLTI